MNNTMNITETRLVLCDGNGLTIKRALAVEVGDVFSRGEIKRSGDVVGTLPEWPALGWTVRRVVLPTVGTTLTVFL